MGRTTYYTLSDDQGRLVRCKCGGAMFTDWHDDEDFLYMTCAKCKYENVFSAHAEHKILRVGDGGRKEAMTR